MYESPIQVIYKDVEWQLEANIVNALQKVEVIVDREELIKALAYDRDQYKKGYEDGRKAAERKRGWWEVRHYGNSEYTVCSICGNVGSGRYCWYCGTFMDNAEEIRL